MAKITDASRLLPSVKSSSAIVKVGKNNSINIVAKSSSLSKALIDKKQVKNLNDVGGKLVKIDKFLKSDLIVSQKKVEIKRKEKEKQDFEEAEKKLETPKSLGFNLPKISLPSIGLFERIKRFLFFTALGWLLPKIIEFLPKLEGIAKVIGNVYKFAEGIFGKLFDGFMSLVKFGGDLKDKTIGFIAQAKAGVGGNYQTEFDKLEKQFNNFVNISIIAGVLGTDIGLAAVDEYNKWRNKNKTPKGPKGPEGKPKPPAGKPSKTKPPKPKPSLWQKLTGGVKEKFSGFAGKLKGPFSKFAGAAIPGLGAAVGYMDAQARAKSGDKLGAFLAGLSAGLDAFTAAVAIAGIGAAATGVGLPGAAVLGAVAGVAGTVSMAIDVILLVRDILKAVGVPVFNKGGRIVRGYQGGGSTRGGRPVSRPARRTIQPARIKKPPKIKPPKSQPGKDVGGEKKIKEFYSKPLDPSQRYVRPAGGWLSTLFSGPRKDERPYKAITTTAKILKEIPLVGGLMGAAVDIALGQKPDPKVYRSLSSGIAYLTETLAKERASVSMSSLMREINSFAVGGTVPSRELKKSYEMNTKDLLSKVLGTTIDQRVNEAIQSIEKELMLKKESGNAGQRPGQRPGQQSDSEDYDTPGARLRDGSNAQIEADLLEYFTAIYGENAAIGIVANLRRESGYRTSTPDNSSYEGMAQWDRGDRWQRFVKWAESKGLDPYSRNAQAQYITVELRQLGTDKRLKHAKTPEEAASLFYNEFERGSESKAVKGRAYRPDNKHENLNKEFIRDISKRNTEIGKRTDQVAIRPTTSSSNIEIGQSKVSQDITDFRKFRSTLGGASSRKPTANPEYYQIREMGVYGSGNYQINPLADDTNYEINVHRGSGHWENRAFDIPVPSSSKEGDAVAEYWRSKGYTVLWRTSGHYDHVHVEVPSSKAKDWFKIVKDANPSLTQVQTKIRDMKIGDPPISVPGVGKVIIKKNSEGTTIKEYYDVNNNKIDSRKFFELYNQRRPQTQKPVPPKPKPKAQLTQRGRGQGGPGSVKMQGGGLIAPSTSNRPIPNSFASYENYGQGMMIAIQPMIIEKKVPMTSGSGGMIAFPVPVMVNNNTEDLLSLSRG